MKNTLICRTPEQTKMAFREAYDAVMSYVIRGDEAVIEFKKKTRSIEQNKRMWAMLTDISNQVIWYNEKLTPDNWKDIFTAALKQEKIVPGINGGFVVLGAKTSQMSIKEMCELQELMTAFGAEKGVFWSEK